MQILRRFKSFSNFKVHAWTKPPRDELLYISLFRRLFNTLGEVEAIRLHSPDGAYNMEYLLASLSKTRLKETGSNTTSFNAFG